MQVFGQADLCFMCFEHLTAARDFTMGKSCITLINKNTGRKQLAERNNIPAGAASSFTGGSGICAGG
jgi:hypothetical protein